MTGAEILAGPPDESDPRSAGERRANFGTFRNPIRHRQNFSAGFKCIFRFEFSASAGSKFAFHRGRFFL
jgi:hypothetical protein